MLALCHSAYIDKHGIKPFLQPFSRDLQKLESDEGVAALLNGEKYIMRVTIPCVVADGQAAHELFCLLSSSARHFCRLCMINIKNCMKVKIIPNSDLKCSIINI